MSTDEKLGVCPLAPLLLAALLGEALGVAPEALPPAALSEGFVSVALVLEPLDPDEPLLAPDEPEVCATETPASARSAAAVAVPTTFSNMSEILLGVFGETAARPMQRACRAAGVRCVFVERFPLQKHLDRAKRIADKKGQ